MKKLLSAVFLAVLVCAAPAWAQKKTVILNLGGGQGIPLPVVNGECLIGSGTKAVWGSCSGAGTAVTSVTGTAGQITASPTTGDVILTLPGTITENLTFSGTHTLNGTVGGTGLAAYLASPPAIGGTAPAAGAFTTLSATSTVSGAGFSTYLASPPAIGGSAPAAGNFTSGGFTGATSFGAGITATGLSAGTIATNSFIGLNASNQFVLGAGGGGGGSGTVTSIATTAPITGGTITTTGTIACATCVTSAASLTSNAVMTGGGSQASQTDTSVTAIGGALALGSSGTVGTLTMGNGTSGTYKIQAPATGALGTSVLTLPIGSTDFSATGGASQFVKQNSSGAALTVAQPAFTDISGSLTLAQMPTQLTNTILGNSSGSTAVPSAQTIGAGLVMNANGLQTTVPDVTKSANYTVAAGDMGGVIYLTGTGTLTIPAISSTVLTTGMSVSYQNIGSGNWTISSTPTINGLPNTTVYPGANGTLVGNGTTLDWTGFASPTSTALGGVITKDCTSGGQFIQKIDTTGTPTCATPAGGGNVSAAGTLALHTVVIGAGSQSVVATATGASGIALIGQGASADPIFGTVVPAGGGTGLTTITAHALMAGEGTGNVAPIGPSSTTGALLASAGASSDPAFDTNATVVAGALSLGASGTLGSVIMGNATSGTLTLQPAAGAISGTVLIPTGSDTLVNLTGTQTLTNKTLTTAALGSSTASTQTAGDNSTKVATTAYVDQAKTWTTVQTFTNSDIKLLGSSTGATTFTSDNAGASNFTIHVPAANDTIDVIGTAQTFTAAKTFTQSDFLLLGSSTGKTTLNSGLSSSGNNTLTLPITATDTLAGLGTVQSWTAAQTFGASDIVLTGASGCATFTTGVLSGTGSACGSGGGGGFAGPIRPTSVYLGGGAGKLFPNFFAGTGGNASATEEGIGIMASLDADEVAQLRFQMPPTIPSGTLKLYCKFLSAGTGTIKYTVSDADVADGASPSGATLTGETQTSQALGTAQTYTGVKTSLTHSTPSANDMSVVAITFNTSGWTAASVVTGICSEIWE